ncbi:hypothetical protein HGRIS_009831 [Hohenbuehelia grisea]|uniref:Enhancer of mRNA-decapping protein 3 n=1 Tax=Hohenbuehelia grisea TaxID=104357 RepID=A0ABR3J2R9_9AGAR
MSKPTMMQTLLKRPSQTYSFPADKDYFSTKQAMLRIAAEASYPLPNNTTGNFNNQPGRAPVPSPARVARSSVNVAHNAHNHASSPSATASGSTHDPAKTRKAHSTTSSSSSASRASQSKPSSSPTRTRKHPLGGPSQSSPGPSSPRAVRRRRSSTTSRVSASRIRAIRQAGGDGSDSDSASSQDIFYTPNTSPRSSMASSVVLASVPFPVHSHGGQVFPPPPMVGAMSLEAAALALQAASSVSQNSLPKPANFPSKSSAPSISTASLASTISLDGHDSSLFSFSPSDETRVTTPLLSDEGRAPLKQKKRSVSAPAPSQPPTPSRSRADLSSIPVKSTTTRPLARKSSSSSRAKRTQATHYTTEDWARDVRWLTPPGNMSSKRDMTNPPSKQRRRPSANSQQWVDPPTLDHLNPPRTSKKAKAKALSKGPPSMGMGMSTLVEEDEDRLSTLSGRSRSVKSGKEGGADFMGSPRSSVLLHAETLEPIREDRRAGTLDVLDHDGGSDRGLRPQRSHSLGYAQSRRSAVSSNSDWVYVPTSYVSEAPSLPSHGTPGYTSLSLPRAPPPPSASLGLGLGAGNVEGRLALDSSGKIDLTRSGIAQTTMATVEVVRGLSKAQVSSPLRSKSLRAVKGLFRGGRRTGGGSISAPNSAPQGHELGFTSYRAPPSQVSADSVLVQVWAVAVDEVDWRLIGAPEDGMSIGMTECVEAGKGTGWLGRSRTFSGTGSGKAEGKRPEVGYIPGRSFVGRVLEVGWEVREEFVRKGEWVIGLLDVRKCGAMAQFVVVDRHRIHRVPHPLMDNNSLPDDSSGKASPGFNSSPSRSTSSRSSASSRSRPHRSLSKRGSPAPALTPTLTLEELALLPLCAVPAYRAVRTLDLGTSGSTGNTDDPAGEIKRRAVVLRGHDGAGAMVSQILARRGWRVCIHAPLPVLSPLDPTTGTAVPDESRMKDIEDRAREWGVEEVVFDDGGLADDVTSPISPGARASSAPVVRVLERLFDDGDIFDAVVDTIGGKDVWSAAERLLQAPTTPADGQGPRSAGQFTTLAGDIPERPIPTAGDLFRSGLRSWRIGANGNSKRERHASMGEASATGKGTSGLQGLSAPSSRRASEDDPAGGPVSPGGVSIRSESTRGKGKGKVGYAWVSVAQDLDWEGEDVRDTLSTVLRLALEEGIRPHGAGGGRLRPATPGRIVPFEKAPDVFVGGKDGMGGVLRAGGAVVVKVVE